MPPLLLSPMTMTLMVLPPPLLLPLLLSLPLLLVMPIPLSR